MLVAAPSCVRPPFCFPCICFPCIFLSRRRLCTSGESHISLQVFYTSFFPVFCSPPILWAARCVPAFAQRESVTVGGASAGENVTVGGRHELKTVFGYGLLCACIMCPMAVAGDV